MTMTDDRTGYPDWELWLAHKIIMTINQNSRFGIEYATLPVYFYV